MRYSKYTTMSDDIYQFVRKLDGGIRKGDVDGAIGLQMSAKAKYGLQFGRMMEDYVMAEEDLWRERSPRRVVFPETEVQLRRLLSDEFVLTDAAGIEPPFESFVLALPKGFEVDGVELPSCLITWLPALAHVGKALDGFLARHNLPPSLVQIKPDNRDEHSLSIIVRARDGTLSRVMAYQRFIPDLLKSRDINEYRARVGNLSDNVIARDLDEYDSKQQYYLLRLVAAVSVYIAAYGEAALTEGFRNAAQRTAMLPKTVKTVKGYTLHDVDRAAPSAPDTATATDAPSIFVQFDAEDAPEDAPARRQKRKSRWVFVRNPSSMPTDFD